MFRSFTSEFKYNLRDKLDISEITHIFTSEDMENMPLESRMWFRMNFTSGVFSSSPLLRLKLTILVQSAAARGLGTTI